jgi:hypothetical protein
MQRRTLTLTASALGLAAAMTGAQAQATKVVESAGVGVSLTLPAKWEARDRGDDIFVDCAPGTQTIRNGAPGCFFTIQRRRIAAGQAAITGEDRAKWQQWTLGGSTRRLVSATDVKVAGYPAHEVLVREVRGEKFSTRLFVLIPGSHVVDASHYAYWDDKDQSAATLPAFRVAMATLKPLP